MYCLLSCPAPVPQTVCILPVALAPRSVEGPPQNCTGTASQGCTADSRSSKYKYKHRSKGIDIHTYIDIDKDT